MTDSLIDALQAKHLRDLKPYESARRLFSGGQDWLNANESPFVGEYNLDSRKLNRYPDCQPKAVIQAYAAYAGVTPEQVLVSRGADEGIELLIRAFCDAGQDSILICPPTYGMYAISAETFNVKVNKAPLNADFSLNLDAMAEFVGKVKVVFICSPNNPTGTQVAPEQIEQALALFAGSALVAVDEAYIEFAQGQGWAGQLANYPNLVVLRTLSKAFGLAGIRCGFTLASPAIIQVLLKAIAPYPLAEPVAQIAAQALSPQGLAWMQEKVEVLNVLRQRLQDQLQPLGDFVRVGDCQANFILLRSQYKQGLMDDLVAQGILIRDQSKQLGLENCLRISIGTEEQNQRLVAAMQRFFEEKAI
ncbi:histidinol-phosphate transaminase [Bowmanella yangjiangensis]|uniref:Histidinol-phosphate aminotransferase n=1 Tax=Bowmanella yangjiangensis TaxID=2811230 RepID=A0ABS3CUY2_9ALTE|nr:histidinol-phosphate transaminase [Bowmanella yangjiangensis]MBN7820917.1 histidinol-phosphate transaminase [Bowmanella yangjiangensis]